MIRRRVTVQGRVQGVWYRSGCQREAERLGVAGWVRNCADGRVEAVLEGTATAVDALVGWMRDGPPRAEVSSVTVTEEEPGGLSGFEVR